MYAVLKNDRIIHHVTINEDNASKNFSSNCLFFFRYSGAGSFTFEEINSRKEKKKEKEKEAPYRRNSSNRNVMFNFQNVTFARSFSTQVSFFFAQIPTFCISRITSIKIPNNSPKSRCIREVVKFPTSCVYVLQLYRARNESEKESND